MRLYSEEQPQEAVAHLEAALREYLVADAECRALCEGPYDYDGYNYLEYNADLFQAIAGERLPAPRTAARPLHLPTHPPAPALASWPGLPGPRISPRARLLNALGPPMVVLPFCRKVEQNPAEFLELFWDSEKKK